MNRILPSVARSCQLSIIHLVELSGKLLNVANRQRVNHAGAGSSPADQPRRAEIVPSHQETIMQKTLFLIAAIGTVLAGSTLGAQARNLDSNGQQALSSCTKNASGCTVLTNDGGGLIIMGNSSGATIYCPPGGKGKCHTTN
jgi:hypothetical protein